MAYINLALNIVILYLVGTILIKYRSNIMRIDNDLLAWCYQRGRDAYDEGIRCTPNFDNDLTAKLKEEHTQDYLPYMKRWIEGWKDEADE